MVSDTEIRILERQALTTGDPEVALTLYRSMLRHGKEPAAPQKIVYEVNDVLEDTILITLFDPDDGVVLLQRKKLHIYVESAGKSGNIIPIFETWPALLGHIEFALTNHATNLQGQLIPIAILNKPDTAHPVVSQRRLQVCDEAAREFFRKIREWGFQHPEAIAAAKLELLRFKLHLFHTKYQRELEVLKETEAKLAISLINLLQA